MFEFNPSYEHSVAQPIPGRYQYTRFFWRFSLIQKLCWVELRCKLAEHLPRLSSKNCSL